MRLSLPLLHQSVFLLLASLRGVPMLASERTQVGASSCVRLPSVLPPSLPSSVDVLRFADILSRHGFVPRLNKRHFKPSDPDRSEAIFRQNLKCIGFCTVSSLKITILIYGFV